MTAIEPEIRGRVRMPMAAKGLGPSVGSSRGFAFRIMLLKAAPLMVRRGSYRTHFGGFHVNCGLQGRLTGFWATAPEQSHAIFILLCALPLSPAPSALPDPETCRKLT